MSLNPPIHNWQGQRVWLVGASSGIGLALAEHLHARGAQVTVSARNARALHDFSRQHPGSVALPMDVTDRTSVRAAVAQTLAVCAPDLVCYCVGHFSPMRATAMDLDEMLRHHQVNTVGALNLLDAITPAMLARGIGHISLVSSVAGLRGLPRSLAYGPTKAALTHLAEVLYLDLSACGLGVSVVHPGFVDTPLTAHNDFPMPAMVSAQTAARAIVQGWERGAFEIHFPKRFTRLLKVMRLLPYGLYFPLIRLATQSR